MPLGFNVQEYVQDALNVMRGRRIEVELLFSKRASAWVKDKTCASEPGNQTLEGRPAQTDLESRRQRRTGRLDIELWG